MAPRRGGEGGGWSVPCPACNKPLYLEGYHWKVGVLRILCFSILMYIQDAKTNALFALWVIALFVLVACLILSTRFKWQRQVGLDKLRRKGYVIAASSAFMYTLRSSSEECIC